MKKIVESEKKATTRLRTRQTSANNDPGAAIVVHGIRAVTPIGTGGGGL
jgi:hypothetical protein